MDLIKGLIVNQLEILGLDLGRRSRGDDDYYLKCRCSGCRKIVSVLSKHIEEEHQKSCKRIGHCNIEDPMMAKKFFGPFRLIKLDKFNPNAGNFNHYVVQCLHCDKQCSRRGVHLRDGIASKCPHCKASDQQPTQYN